jgi:hypothetical protein
MLRFQPEAIALGLAARYGGLASPAKAARVGALQGDQRAPGAGGDEAPQQIFDGRCAIQSSPQPPLVTHGAAGQGR